MFEIPKKKVGENFVSQLFPLFNEFEGQSARNWFFQVEGGQYFCTHLLGTLKIGPTTHSD